ncbi:hypothetical protein D3C75_1134760 [compost metagenome]
MVLIQIPALFPAIADNRLPLIVGVFKHHRVQGTPVAFFVIAGNPKATAPRHLIVMIRLVVHKTGVPTDKRQIKIVVLRVLPGLRDTAG